MADIKQAAKWLQEGKKVRRAIWHSDAYFICRPFGERVIKDMVHDHPDWNWEKINAETLSPTPVLATDYPGISDMQITMNLNDIMAEDWEIHS